ncbi:hypothetical protein Tco_1501566 [Tanacetum coccineum]
MISVSFQGFNTMADVNSQRHPIYKIVVDILKHTNFFRAFTASSTIPSIYIQQFWDTVRYVKNTGSYSCQLDEQWFDLTKDTLRDALQITPVDNNNPFSSPPTPDALINFVNELGYPKVVRTLSAVVTNDMFQPWRALTTIINLCLTGKTSAFERPRAPVLQILWGVVNRAHIDYAERMWEEFTQSIHSFVEDKKNLALHTQGKKKANPLVIPSYVLGYLKFSAKGTKREVFGMPIPNDLITDDIRGEQYYNEYLEKVAKHQRYLAGEEVSDPDSPAPKPAKATKPKATKQSKPLAPKAAPKDQSKKRKLVKESSEAPSLAKRPKAGKVIKKRKPKSSLQLIDEFVDEGVPDKEPVYGDEEADTQRAIEESLKEVHDAHRGPLPVVIREPDSGKFQPLPDVQGKGKEKVSDEQVALDLLTLQTPKKKSPAEQYIFQRRSSAPTEPSGHDESSSLYAETPTQPRLIDSETESDEDSDRVDAGGSDEGRLEPKPCSAWTLFFLLNLDKELIAVLKIRPISPFGESQEDEPEISTSIYNGSSTTTNINIQLSQQSQQQHLFAKHHLNHNKAPHIPSWIMHIGEILSNYADLVNKAVDEFSHMLLNWYSSASTSGNRFRDWPEAEMKKILSPPHV